MTEEMTDDTKTTSPAALLARQLWVNAFRAANPDADPETVKAAWAAEAPAYRKTVKTALRQLEKKGVTLQQA